MTTKKVVTAYASKSRLLKDVEKKLLSFLAVEAGSDDKTFSFETTFTVMLNNIISECRIPVEIIYDQNNQPERVCIYGNRLSKSISKPIILRVDDLGSSPESGRRRLLELFSGFVQSRQASKK